MKLSGIISVVDINFYQRSKSYLVITPVYEGPLDLLLNLIERAELDITRISLAQVTDQYLDHLQTIQETLPDEVSSFLVIASKLIQIKSEALLPRPPIREPGEEDPGEALARQLKLYKKYKEIALNFSDRENDRLRTYLRLSPPPKLDSTLNLDGIDITDLLSAAQNVFMATDPHLSIDPVLTPLRITIRQRIQHITQMLIANSSTSFQHLFSDGSSQLEIVITFLAILELIKRRKIRVQQSTLFGEIYLFSEGILNEREDFELEFED